MREVTHWFVVWCRLLTGHRPIANSRLAHRVTRKADCIIYDPRNHILPSSVSFLRQDVPLISLANILHNAKLWNDAVIVATMAVEIAPHFAVNHFTLGNVYVAMVRLACGQEPLLCPALGGSALLSDLR